MFLSFSLNHSLSSCRLFLLLLQNILHSNYVALCTFNFLTHTNNCTICQRKSHRNKTYRLQNLRKKPAWENGYMFRKRSMIVSAVSLHPLPMLSHCLLFSLRQSFVFGAALIPDHVCLMQNVLVKLRSEQSGNLTAVYAKHTETRALCSSRVCPHDAFEGCNMNASHNAERRDARWSKNNTRLSQTRMIML